MPSNFFINDILDDIIYVYSVSPIPRNELLRDQTKFLNTLHSATAFIYVQSAGGRWVFSVITHVKCHNGIYKN